MGETVQLLFPVFTVRFVFTPIVFFAFVRISTKSNFILLRLYGENVLYKLRMKGWVTRGVVKTLDLVVKVASKGLRMVDGSHQPGKQPSLIPVIITLLRCACLSCLREFPLTV